MKKYWLLACFFCWMVWSCRPQPNGAELIDQFVVATNYDTAANFSSYSTYSIPLDTIGFVSNTDPDTIKVGSGYPRSVVNAVIGNLNDRGYTKVNKDQNPDWAINVYVITDLNVFQQIVYSGYGYGYSGYYYPSYYGYGSYYSYPYVNTYAYNTGALVVEIVDLKNITPDHEVKVIWNASMGDVYSAINQLQQSLDGINQSFNQSPYVQK